MRRVAVLAAVCLLSVFPATACRAAEEDNVKEAFAGFQEAIKSKDGARVYDLLDSTSQASAKKFAGSYKAKYAKADDDDKKAQEKALGLTADEMARLDAKLFLKSNRYHGKYHEVPGSKLDKVTIDGDNATVSYTEEDGDKEKLNLIRQDGKWKVSAPPP